MKFNRNIIVFCILVIVCEAVPDDRPRRSLLLFPPRRISIFSRPHPLPEHDEQHKGGILSHVLQGGSIGIEIRPLAPLQGILDHAKKFIPGHGTVGRPSYERPNDDKDYDEGPHEERPNHDKERPNKDHGHYERPAYERPPYYERPNKDHAHYERPNQPRPQIVPPKKDEEWEKDPGPQWEDIGEVPSTEEEYGEGVLQPRRRPKRFVESRIYHVPLMFRSNGRADKVRIKSRLREKNN